MNLNQYIIIWHIFWTYGDVLISGLGPNLRNGLYTSLPCLVLKKHDVPAKMIVDPNWAVYHTDIVIVRKWVPFVTPILIEI